MPGETIRLIDPQGTIRDVPVEAAGSALDSGWSIPTAAQDVSRVAEHAREANYGGVVGGVKAGAAALARGATLGLSDVAARAIGGEDTAIALEGYREAHPYLSTGAELAGAVAPAFFTGGAALPAGAAGGVGRGVAAAAGGGLRGAVAGGVVEGGLFGLGSGVSELALSQDPLTLEHAASALGSNALFGAAAGGALGGAFNVVERGLVKAGRVLEEKIAERAAAAEVTGDLSALDAKGLRAARDAEVDRLAAEHATTTSAARSASVDDVIAYRQTVKDANPWLAIGEGEPAAQLSKANKALRLALDDAKGLRENPGSLLRPLRKEEQAFEGAITDRANIAAKLDEIDAKIAGEIEGAASPRSALPDHETIGAHESRADDYLETTVQARDIAGHGYYEPPGGGTDPVRIGKAKQAIADGQREAIKLNVSPTGKITVTDGRHRLAAAIEADKPIKVKWSTGFEPLEDDVLHAASASREMSNKEFDDWTIDLERKVTSSEWTAGQDYQNGAFGINYALRTGEVPADYPLVKNLDARIEKSRLPSDAVLYRGVQGDEVYEKLSVLKPGESFVEKGYTSTAVSPADAHGSEAILSKNGVTKEQYKTWKGIQLEIEAPKGSRGAALPWDENFGREVVLPRNQRFTVRSIEHYPDGQIKRMRLAATSDLPSQVSSPVELTGRAARRYATFADVKLPKGGAVTLDPAKAEAFLQALKSGEVASASRKSLDALDGLLEQNRALQKKIADAAAPRLPRSELTSERLTAIDAAKDTLGARNEPSLLEKAASGGIFGAASGAASAIPLIGQIPGVAHLIGAKAAEAITGLVFGRIGRVTVEGLEHTKSAVDTIAGVTKSATKYSAPVASKTLSAVRFATQQRDEDDDKKPLPELYKQRTEEVKRLTEYDETGTPRMRFDVRQRVAQLLKPIAAVDPIAADRMETLVARRIAHVSAAIPRRPDFGTPQLGPDNWQPSDMQMRSWARTVAASEDPHGVEERAAHGALTPEDVKAYWAIYPERAQSFKMQILGAVGTKQAKTMSFSRALGLSMLLGQPLHPALHPRVLAVLQGQFPAEPGTSGGSQPPRAALQFGSIKKEARTPAQERAVR